MSENKKPFVFDLPVKKTQRFKVSLPGVKTRFFVTRTELILQQHNMVCTDGMKEGEVSKRVDWDVEIEKTPDPYLSQKAIDAVREFLKDEVEES